MILEPNRAQAIALQARLKKFYEEVGGEYYAGEDAWEYMEKETGVDLKHLLEYARGW